ncbi:MAG: AMP-binding enzyme, partial [Candidatus Woesearchaeota archaeon]
SVPCLEFDLSSLKVLGSVGEPIDEKTWTWYFEHVGAKRCSIQDTWWQTETGGILIAPGKQFDDTKAGWALCPMKGIAPTVVDVSDGVGKLFIEKSWPGQALTILNNHALYETLYFNTKHGFFTGDLAVFDQNNTYFKILGRFDDVINVSGHRFGVAELEDAVMKSGNVSEIAVIAVDDSVSGSALVAVYVAEGIVDVQKILRNAIGPVARIATAIRVRALPKTRSGKVMRRVLRDVYEGKDVTNIQGIEDDSLLLQLQEAFCRTS